MTQFIFNTLINQYSFFIFKKHLIFYHILNFHFNKNSNKINIDLILYIFISHHRSSQNATNLAKSRNPLIFNIQSRKIHPHRNTTNIFLNKLNIRTPLFHNNKFLIKIKNTPLQHFIYTIYIFKFHKYNLIL